MTEIMRKLVACRAAGWLSLAAAPTFALMAVVTGISSDGAHQMSCAAAMHAPPLTGMGPMYALMSAFHLTPWLRLRAFRDGSRKNPIMSPMAVHLSDAEIDDLAAYFSALR